MPSSPDASTVASHSRRVWSSSSRRCVRHAVSVTEPSLTTPVAQDRRRARIWAGYQGPYGPWREPEPPPRNSLTRGRTSVRYTAAATNAATERMPMAANPEDAAVPRPIAVATPVMISQIGLVRLLAATKAADGRRMASTNAHTSTISAARASTSKNQLSAEYAPGLLKITLPGYPL